MKICTGILVPQELMNHLIGNRKINKFLGFSTLWSAPKTAFKHKYAAHLREICHMVLEHSQRAFTETLIYWVKRGVGMQDCRFSWITFANVIICAYWRGKAKPLLFLTVRAKEWVFFKLLRLLFRLDVSADTWTSCIWDVQDWVKSHGRNGCLLHRPLG